ncbi:transketolase family protein [Candidatus Shapirobacteria bacterium]|nr:MAG: transketolase family protein [Candidatus Shapirobacteria bacterium]
MKNKTKLASIRQAFGDTLTALASKNKNIFVVSVDLKSSLKLTKFAQKFPHRFIEAGVAENNATGVAAGLAKTGKTVFVASFSCFSPAINWAVIKQSICYNHANVKIVGSHAGLMSGALGATHQMLEDIALMRVLPNMEVFSPADATETAKITTAISHSRRPAYLRLVRPDTPLFFPPKLSFTIGKSHILQLGQDLTIIGHGPILDTALQAQVKLKNKLSLEIINASSIKPLDQKTILHSLKKTGKLIVVEDHQKIGGLGEAIAHLLLESNLSVPFIHLAVDNQFGQSAKDYSKLYQHYDLDLDSLLRAIKKLT